MKINKYNILTFILFIFTLYEGWYIQKYNAIPFFLQIISLTIFVFTIYCYWEKIFKYIKNKTFLFWGLFGLFSFISSLLSSVIFECLNALITFFCFLMVVFCAGIHSSEQKSIKWLISSLIMLLFLNIISILFWGFDYYSEGYLVKTLGVNNNPNVLGYTMVFALSTVLLFYRPIKIYQIIYKYIIFFLSFYVIICTGSRGSIVSITIVVFLYFIWLYKNISGNEMYFKRILLVVSAIIVFIIAVIFLYTSSSLDGLLRIKEKLNFNSISGRTELYVASFKYFMDKPLFGIGFQAFQYVSTFGYYTHSTYMELLCNSGLIGFFLFFFPIIRKTIYVLKIRTANSGKCVIIMILFFVSSLFSILFYNLIPFMVFYIICSSNLENFAY